MPNFRGRRFTNAHETMIWAARDEKAKGYTFNYEALKAANEDVQARSDWLIPLCTGEERLKRHRRQEGASDPEARRPVGAGAVVVVQARRPRDGFPSTAPAPPGRGKTPRPPLHRLRARRTYAQAAEARIAAIEPLPEASLAPFMTAREAPRVAFSELIERGMIRPGTKLVDSKKRHGALVRCRRRHHARRQGRLDPPHRRGGARLGSLQRLDLLACRDQGRAQADRRDARRNPLGNGGGLKTAPQERF